MNNSDQKKLIELENKQEKGMGGDGSNLELIFKQFLDWYKDSNLTNNEKTLWVKNRLNQIKKARQQEEQIPLLVVHILPKNAFETNTTNINLEDYTVILLPMLDGHTGDSRRINYHGILYSETYSNSYTQLYRNGIVESVCDNVSENKRLYVHQIEIGIIRMVGDYLNAMQNVPDTSFDLHITILNVEGFYFSLPRMLTKNNVIDQKDLYLPCITIKMSSETNIEDAIKPAIDVLWNAGGFPKSLPINAFY